MTDELYNKLQLEYQRQTGVKPRAHDTDSLIEAILNRKESTQYVLNKIKKRTGIDITTFKSGLGKSLSKTPQTVQDIFDNSDATFVSTWGIHCGIATYTAYLMNELKKLCKVGIVSVNERNKLPDKINSTGATHLQFEYGIFGTDIPKSNNTVITWHTIMGNKEVPSADAHIVHSENAKRKLKTHSPVYVIPHGCYQFPETDISKKDIRKILGLPPNKFIVYVPGMRTPEKQYANLSRILTVVHKKRDNVLTVFNSSPHATETNYWRSSFEDRDYPSYTLFLNRWISEVEMTLYALASDAFLFCYVAHPYGSASGILHRIAGAGKPVICNQEATQFDVLEDGKEALKYDKLEEAAEHILTVMDNTELADGIGNNLKKYAKENSWAKVAKMHMDVYDKLKK